MKQLSLETSLLAVLVATILVGCGSSGSRSELPPPTPEAADVPADTPPRAAGRLVLIAAVADKDSYELGEPVLVRRVYENVGDEPVRVTLGDWKARQFREVGITSKSRSRLYEPPAMEVEEVVVEPGARIENRITVELPAPGDYTIEIPPEYQVRGGPGRCSRLPVKVVDRGDVRYVAEKAERLARVIEKEDPECPTCWTEAQNDLQALGQAAVPHLRRWLREAEVAHLRAIAAKLLWFVKGTDGIQDLAAALADPDPNVRKMSLSALGSFQRPETLVAMLTLTKDPDSMVRVELIEAIAVFDDPRVVPAMRVALKDGDPYVRQWAAIHLAEKKGDPSGIQVLIQALETNPALEASRVVPALEKLAGRTFGEPTMPFVHSGDEQIKEAVATNMRLAKHWLAWWETDGRARFGGN